MSERGPKFRIEEDEEYREIHVDGIFGGLNPNGGKMVVYTEEHRPKISSSSGEMELDEVVRELQVELHMSPVQFKSIFEWMKSHLESYEDQFGNVEMGSEGGEDRSPMYR